MNDAILSELRELRAEMRRLRVQQARTMAMLLAMVRPMPAEAAERIERQLMAMDDAP